MRERKAYNTCADPENFVSLGRTLTTFFLVDPNTTKSAPSLVRQRNAIEMALRWRADDGPTLNAGLVAFRISGDPDQYC